MKVKLGDRIKIQLNTEKADNEIITGEVVDIQDVFGSQIGILKPDDEDGQPQTFGSANVIEKL